MGLVPYCNGLQASLIHYLGGHWQYASRRGYHRACIAIAAKNARVAWALLAQEPSAAKGRAAKLRHRQEIHKHCTHRANRSDRRSRNQINLRAEIAA